MVILILALMYLIGAYLLYRRGTDDPTLWERFKAFWKGFRVRNIEDDYEPPRQPAKHPNVVPEEDPQLTDVERVDEIMTLMDIWNQNSEVKRPERKDD